MLQGIPFLAAGFPWSTRYKYEYQWCKVLAITNPLFHPKICPKLMAFVTNVCVNPLDFALASLALLSFLRLATVSMSVSHSSNLVELCSLKTAILCSNEFVRFDCFCVVHKMFVYCHTTSPKGSVCVGGGDEVLSRFCSLHCVLSKVSAGCPPASTH